MAEELSESMFWKAVTATALSFLLSNFGRIDDWLVTLYNHPTFIPEQKLMILYRPSYRTHLGAAFSGIIFGYLTCPTLHFLDNRLSSKDSKNQEGSTLVQRQANPCKSLLIFSISIFILSCLVFFFGPQLELLEMEDFG